MDADAKERNGGGLSLEQRNQIFKEHSTPFVTTAQHSLYIFVVWPFVVFMAELDRVERGGRTMVMINLLLLQFFLFQ